MEKATTEMKSMLICQLWFVSYEHRVFIHDQVPRQAYIWIFASNLQDQK